MKKRQFINVATLICALVILSLLVFIVFNLIEHYLDEKNSGSSDDSFSFDEAKGHLFYGGEWYELNDSIESYLVLGIDKMVNGSGEDSPKSEQSDFVALLVLNKKEDSFQIIQLNRDTMADIPSKDISGKEYGTINAQLALAHTYGSTERERCRNTVKTVENLLYGIDIDHYFSFTMDAVPMLNDSVGGVELTLMDDFTQLDESFEKGAVVTLHGDHALTYVRARSSLEDSTNIHRMERQKQYVKALCEKFHAYDDGTLIKIMSEIGEYMASDCTVDQMSRLAENLEKYEFKGIITLDGESVKGEQYMEFYLNEETTQELVIELFYELLK